MSYLEPLAAGATPDLIEDFAVFQRNLGYIPNAMLILQRKPAILRALAGFNRAVMGRDDDVPIDLKRLIALVATDVSGCGYAMAHQAEASVLLGMSEERIGSVLDFEQSSLYSEPERAALAFARAAAKQPSEVGAEHFAKMRTHWSEEQIVEILMVVSMCAVFDRWNDTLATQLEQSSVDVARRVLSRTAWEVGKHA